MDQYIYLMTNPSINNAVKIGYTCNPIRRCKELSKALPYPMRLNFCWRVSNMKLAEKEIHKHFDRHRMTSDREYFYLDLDFEEAKTGNERYPDLYKEVILDGFIDEIDDVLKKIKIAVYEANFGNVIARSINARVQNRSGVKAYMRMLYPEYEYPVNSKCK